MKYFIKTRVTWLLITVVAMYLIISLLSWNLNYFDWNQIARIMFWVMIISVFLTSVVFIPWTKDGTYISETGPR